MLSTWQSHGVALKQGNCPQLISDHAIPPVGEGCLQESKNLPKLTQSQAKQHNTFGKAPFHLNGLLLHNKNIPMTMLQGTHVKSLFKTMCKKKRKFLQYKCTVLPLAPENVQTLRGITYLACVDLQNHASKWPSAITIGKLLTLTGLPAINQQHRVDAELHPFSWGQEILQEAFGRRFQLPQAESLPKWQEPPPSGVVSWGQCSCRTSKQSKIQCLRNLYPSVTRKSICNLEYNENPDSKHHRACSAPPNAATQHSPQGARRCPSHVKMTYTRINGSWPVLT